MSWHHISIQFLINVMCPFHVYISSLIFYSYLLIKQQSSTQIVFLYALHNTINYQTELMTNRSAIKTLFSVHGSVNPSSEKCTFGIDRDTRTLNKLLR